MTAADALCVRFPDPLCVLLRAERQRRGLSIDAVAKQSEGRFHRAAIASYERGDRNPPLSEIRALLAFYGLTLVAVREVAAQSDTAAMAAAGLDPNCACECAGFDASGRHAHLRAAEFFAQARGRMALKDRWGEGYREALRGVEAWLRDQAGPGRPAIIIPAGTLAAGDRISISSSGHD